jgi:hypothetical protein
MFLYASWTSARLLIWLIIGSFKLLNKLFDDNIDGNINCSCPCLLVFQAGCWCKMALGFVWSWTSVWLWQMWTSDARGLSCCNTLRPTWQAFSAWNLFFFGFTGVITVVLNTKFKLVSFCTLIFVVSMNIRYQSLRKPDMAVIVYRIALTRDTEFYLCVVFAISANNFVFCD